MSKLHEKEIDWESGDYRVRGYWHDFFSHTAYVTEKRVSIFGFAFWMEIQRDSLGTNPHSQASHYHCPIIDADGFVIADYRVEANND